MRHDLTRRRFLQATSGAVGAAALTSSIAPAARAQGWPMDPANCPALPDVSGVTPTFADEFTGSELDTDVWNIRTGPVALSQPWATLRRPENVSLQNGKLTLAVQYHEQPIEDDQGREFHYSGAVIYTEERYRYGYYEARMRNAGYPGWLLAYWSFHPQAENAGSEIDGIEHRSQAPTESASTVHWWHGRGDNDVNTSGHFSPSVPGFDLTSNWHTISYYVQPGGVTFAIDGLVQGCLDWPGPGDDPSGTMNILLTAVARGADDGVPFAKDTPPGESIQFDYVRYYDL